MYPLVLRQGVQQAGNGYHIEPLGLWIWDTRPKASKIAAKDGGI
jgi:hypothetical protein